MSATSSLHNKHQAAINSADMVQQQITSVNTQIQGLGSDLDMLANQVRDLVAQLQALKAPAPPGAGASPEAFAAYQQQMAQYHQKAGTLHRQIDALNAKSQQIATRIEELHNKVHRLQSGDLPNAQRQDAERQERELKAAREQYESHAKALEKSAVDLDADHAARRDAQRVQMRVGGTTSDTSSTADQHLSLRVGWQNLNVDHNSDLRTLVRAFQVVLAVAGDGSDFARRANPAVAMPHTPANGLPPISTP